MSGCIKQGFVRIKKNKKIPTNNQRSSESHIFSVFCDVQQVDYLRKFDYVPEYIFCPDIPFFVLLPVINIK